MTNLYQSILLITFVIASFSCYAKENSAQKNNYFQSINKNTILILKENSNYLKKQPINRIFLGNLKWSNDLQTKIEKDLPFYHVVSKKITETVSSKALQTIFKTIENEKPKIVVISLGENDGLYSKTIKEIRQYLSAIIKIAQNSDAKVILVGNNLPLHYGLNYTNDFVKMYAILAKKYNLAYVPKSKISYTYPLFLNSYSYNQSPNYFYPPLAYPKQATQKPVQPKQQTLKASDKIWVELDKIITREKKNSARLQNFYRYPGMVLSASF